MPCPTYPEIRLALAPGPRVSRMIEEFEPDAIHIETEAPLGIAARRHCVATGYPFTTAYHTQFPEFIHARCRLPLNLTYRMMRSFHDPAAAVMVPTAEMVRRLKERGFANLAFWSRGVDPDVFAPAERLALPGRPIFLYAGRVAIEKSIGDFLELDLPGTKWVVGDGPARAGLEDKYPQDRVSWGEARGRLTYYYQQADAFVFPSRTDTFGLVLVEAMACGTPVAAYPVSGPIDVVREPSIGDSFGELAGRRDRGTRSRSLSGASLCAPIHVGCGNAASRVQPCPDPRCCRGLIVLCSERAQERGVPPDTSRGRKPLRAGRAAAERQSGDP